MDARWVYQSLLGLYPGDYRELFAAEMLAEKARFFSYAEQKESAKLRNLRRKYKLDEEPGEGAAQQ